jgi:hypothetical protein
MKTPGQTGRFFLLQKFEKQSIITSSHKGKSYLFLFDKVLYGLIIELRASRIQ